MPATNTYHQKSIPRFRKLHGVLHHTSHDSSTWSYSTYTVDTPCSISKWDLFLPAKITALFADTRVQQELSVLCASTPAWPDTWTFPHTRDPTPSQPPPPLARAVNRSYLAAKASLRTATSIDEYLAALEDLRAAVKERSAPVSRVGEETPLGVPVKWVKQQLPGAERVYQVGGGR